MTFLALDETSIDHDGVLAFSSIQWGNDVVAELAVSSLGSHLQFMLVIVHSRHVNFAVSEFRDRFRAANAKVADFSDQRAMDDMASFSGKT